MTRAIKLLAFLALLLPPAIAVAGANNATLNCISTSASGEKLQLTGSIPGDLYEFSLTLRSASYSHIMSDSSDTIIVIDDFENHVFALTVKGKDQSILILYGIPDTISHKVGPNGRVDATFAAIFRQALRPSYEPSNNVPFSCAYHYSI